MGFLSDLFGTRSRDRASDAARNAALGSFSFMGPGGMSVGFSPTSGNVALGSLDPIRAMLLGMVPQQLSAGAGTGALSGVADSVSRELAGSGLDPSFLSMLQRMVGAQSGTGAAPSFGATGIDPALLSKLATTAGANLGSFDDIAAERLGTMRAAAQPYEQEFIQKSIGDLFARGRFGSNDSLSGKVSEGVARALSTADLERVMSSQDFARLLQQDSVNATGLLDSLVGNTFDRNVTGFQATQGGYDSEVGRITSLLSQIPGINSTNTSNALSRFSIAQQLFDSQQAGQNAAVGRGLSTLQGAQGIDAQSLQAFMTALQSAVARSNAGANQAQIYSGLSQNTPALDFLGGLISPFTFGK
jgi:uncharacterized tellurite resistance protein B-like protein